MYPCVEILWEDSRQPDPTWAFLSGKPDNTIVLCRTVGWLIEDGAVKVVAATIGDEGLEDPQTIGRMRIPARCVVDIKVLSVAPLQVGDADTLEAAGIAILQAPQ